MIIREINISHDHAIGEPVTMLDYGLKLKLAGVELPPSYEVHFSNGLNQPATVAIGDASGVVVPYEYTEMSGTLYGWLYLHHSTLDGYTERSFAVKIIRRSAIDPPQVLPPQATVIEQAIVALNMAIERTEAARDAAEESAGEAEQSAQQAAQSAAGAANSAAESAASATAAAESAADASASQATAQAAATRAEFAMEAARASAESADESATLAQTAVEESATNAQNAADSASEAIAARAQAAADANRANTYATRAQASANTASNAATAASNSAGAALNHANSAATSATAAQTAQTAAETAAGTATEKATEASESAADAAESATQAEEAATQAGQIVDDATAWALGAYATSSASGAVATVDDGAEDVPVKALTAYIVPVQDGTGDPSPDNVRPIHGWTGMSLKRTGKNLADINRFITEATVYGGWAVDSDGWYYGDDRALYVTYGADRRSFLSGLGADSVSVSFLMYTPEDFTGSSVIVTARYTDGTFAYIVNGGYSSTPVLRQGTVTAPTGKKIASVAFSYGLAVIIHMKDLQIELSSSATPYEPYTGQVYPVTWQDVAGTVYGGYYEAVTGKLTVTHAAVDMGTLNWTMGNTGVFSLPVLSNMAIVPNTVAANFMTPIYKTIKGDDGTQYTTDVIYMVNNMTVRVKDTRFDTLADFKTAVTGQTLVYELTTPITYNLTPLEIKTLKGVNNFFADTGDVDATVRCDPDLHLAALIAQAVALSQNG